MLHIRRVVLHLQYNNQNAAETQLRDIDADVAGHLMPAMTVLRGITPMSSSIVIVLANAAPLPPHNMLTVGERQKECTPLPAHSSLQPPTTSTLSALQ